MLDSELTPLFSRGLRDSAIARNRMGAEELLPDTAYQIVHDEALLDGNARLNLATFVSTWMDGHADRLYADTFDKNMIDKDEYPSTAAVEAHCWRILADLWNAPDVADAVGTSTTGSSEAAMLGGLAFKRRWQHARRAAGKPTDRPNLVMSSAVQVCWEKFCNYFDVEPRFVPVSEQHPVFDGHDLASHVDENTIGVVAIMGVTYTGAYEPVKKIAAALDRIQEDTGLDVPIHVDGASGAMIAPFLQPELDWDFRLERVHSINPSGHKYGGVYPGLGWVVWRDEKWLPDDLVFRVSYLGGDMPTFALNFSRPGAQVLLQYYLFPRLGYAGYTAMQQSSQDVAVHLSSSIEKMGPFELISDGTDIPVFAWRLTDGYTDRWNLHHLSDRLRMHGWLVPTYPLPVDRDEIIVQRIVVRNDLSIDIADKLLADIRAEVEYLDQLDAPMPTSGQQPGFHH
ncbi:glutamate decarboxylase [Microbacterium sp. LRZ72]|uniref:glutamate decarboxylase n=1 Tax=Microbacterium sp. LRZ72 TaxID=2942481 RepID=UPI0029B435E9|nr:glutamate decarboxylase [Microbacterium sp. LRZ72]MDX2377471.1 glutamate decarboxylase [Microbacterium sp. LRZ72]